MATTYRRLGIGIVGSGFNAGFHLQAFVGVRDADVIGLSSDGLEVVRLLMAAYMSAEQGKTLSFPPPGLAEFIPAVARGEWRP
jgi:hypothetical protein